MGQRQNQTEIVYGEDCLLGWDAGETPKYLYARFSKIIKCEYMLPVFPDPIPNDHAFTLTQIEDFPCAWQYVSPLWWVKVTVVDDPLRVTLLFVYHLQNWILFQDEIAGPPDEDTIYENELLVCDGVKVAMEGIASVTWRLETIQLLSALNITTSYDLFMEMRPLDDGNKVYKFCNLSDGTNIKILLEPD